MRKMKETSGWSKKIKVKMEVEIPTLLTKKLVSLGSSGYKRGALVIPAQWHAYLGWNDNETVFVELDPEKKTINIRKHY